MPARFRRGGCYQPVRTRRLSRQRLGACLVHGQVQRESAPGALLAVDGDLAAQLSCDFPADSQAEASATVPAARGAVPLVERAKDGADVVAGDTDARVSDGERHGRPAAGHSAVSGLDPYPDAAVLGELHYVREQAGTARGLGEPDRRHQGGQRAGLAGGRDAGDRA